MRTKILAAVAILAVVAFIGIHRWSRPTQPMRSGNAATLPLAPDFSLKDSSGQTLRLSRYRGKVVLLNFWAIWCSPCRSEIPRFMNLQNKYGREGLQIVGISLDDDPRLVHAFYQQLKMNYPVGIGGANLAEQRGVLGLPVSFLIGRDGRICAKLVGETDISLIKREMKPLL